MCDITSTIGQNKLTMKCISYTGAKKTTTTKKTFLSYVILYWQIYAYTLWIRTVKGAILLLNLCKLLFNCSVDFADDAFTVCWCLWVDMECHDFSYLGQLSLANGPKPKSHKCLWWNDLKATKIVTISVYIQQMLNTLRQLMNTGQGGKGRRNRNGDNLLMRCHLHTQLSSGLITAIKPSKLLLVQSYTLSLLFFIRKNSSQLSQPSTSNWSNDWNVLLLFFCVFFCKRISNKQEY